MRKTALTIAGSDCSGGAGIQADIKTMMANGVYAMSVVTALTAQNTTGVSSVMEVTPEFLSEQLDSVFRDIFPDAVKIGMVSSAELIEVIAEKLREYGAKNIVLDPVMAAASGSRLLREDAADILTTRLFPLADVITPNIPEAEQIAGCRIVTMQEMERTAEEIGLTYHTSVLIKGGHGVKDADDLLYHDGEKIWFYGERIDTRNTHGTGCTLSSAIAANLAKGYDLPESIRMAKEYLTGALSAGLNLGTGSGPVDHGFRIKEE